MAKNASDKLEARLKAVLDGLAEARWAGGNPNAGVVLAEAVKQVPFDEHEAFLLSGGIPRGHKALTTATAKLAKVGWMVKGRSGWSITDDGLRALVAFPTVDALAEALAEGTPIPAEVAVPAAPTKAKKASEPTAEKAPAKRTAKKAAAAEAPAAEAREAAQPEEQPLVSDQPQSVAIAGDFGAALGAESDWEPSLDAVQMGLDAEAAQWRRTVDLPAGTYTFKIAIDRSWDENYGAFGFPGGANHELKHDGGPVTIVYNHATKDVTFS
ncbi:glycosidase [Sinomonas sp. ASV322]|uniref:pullulanase X25 domain-containing protein n=1 Tax=Sinomonas sp. ASV322 TaxID=3041920 RepID=UPI0027DD3644|nr:glycosidase [Sinomonas sp. ASV322]MDQ4503078.1 glycosidase [Sinomonas sp. ASV322]